MPVPTEPPFDSELWDDLWPDVRALLIEGRSYRAIEARVGVSYETARRWASAAGMGRARSKPGRARARRMHSDGQGVTKIARTLGVSRPTVYRWVTTKKPPGGRGAIPSRRPISGPRELQPRRAS